VQACQNAPAAKSKGNFINDGGPRRGGDKRGGYRVAEEGDLRRISRGKRRGRRAQPAEDVGLEAIESISLTEVWVGLVLSLRWRRSKGMIT